MLIKLNIFHNLISKIRRNVRSFYIFFFPQSLSCLCEISKRADFGWRENKRFRLGEKKQKAVFDRALYICRLKKKDVLEDLFNNYFS